MQVFILANGDRMNQLIEIDGETILHRTVRQLNDRGVTPTLITRHQELVDVVSDLRIKLFAPGDEGAAAVLGRSSCHLWDDNGDNLILLGDVRFSDAAMDTVLAPVRSWTAFLRFGPRSGSRVIGGEVWGVGFPGRDTLRYRDLLDELHYEFGGHEHASFWYQYRMWNCADAHDHRVFRHHVIIDDETEDFDYPSDLEAWLKKNRR